MIKYVQLKNSDLDPANVRKIVEDVFARPLVYLTDYKELSDKELLSKEVELITTATIRGKTLLFLAQVVVQTIGFLVDAVSTFGFSLFKTPFKTIVQAREAMLLYHNLSHCRQELLQRGIQPQCPINVSVGAGNAIIMLSSSILGLLQAPTVKTSIADEAKKYLVENISHAKAVNDLSVSATSPTWLKDALRLPTVQNAMDKISSKFPDLAIKSAGGKTANQVIAVAEAHDGKKQKRKQKQQLNQKQKQPPKQKQPLKQRQ